ncbi:MAG: phasin family protein [Betaproteobacteria bacterium]|nr:phasin family protein [Betaproteobacteria bacterium]
MTKATERQLAGWNREAIEAALQLAKVSTENAEKLARLQLETMRSLLEASFKNAQALAEIKDPQQFAERRARMLEQSVEQMVDYSRKVYDLASATQCEFGKLMETRFASFNRDIGHLVDSASRTAPAGSEPALAAIRQALAASNAVVETLTRTARQFAHVTDANIKSAASAAKGGGKKRA